MKVRARCAPDCVLGYCEDGDPTDPWGGDGCKDSPETKTLVYQRGADGRFAEIQAP